MQDLRKFIKIALKIPNHLLSPPSTGGSSPHFLPLLKAQTSSSLSAATNPPCSVSFLVCTTQSEGVLPQSTATLQVANFWLCHALTSGHEKGLYNTGGGKEASGEGTGL